MKTTLLVIVNLFMQLISSVSNLVNIRICHKCYSIVKASELKLAPTGGHLARWCHDCIVEDIEKKQ